MVYSERDKISLKQVKLELYNVLCFKLPDNILLGRCINDIFSGAFTPKYWNYNEYYTYLHVGYKHKIIDRYNYYTHKNVLLKFN